MTPPNRTGGCATERGMNMDIEVKALSPGLEGAFLDFFDHHAFTDNPSWAPCYCCFYKTDCTRKEWMKRTAQQNRELAVQLIRSGEMHAYLAFANGEPVGWCHADAREKMTRLEDLQDPSEKAASIVCFVIAPEWRRKGIATRLLQYVLQDCKSRGFELVEAYPCRSGKTDAVQYHGPEAMYRKAGFTERGGNEDYLFMARRLDEERAE